MKYCDIDTLKNLSDFWVNKKTKYLTENSVYYIDTNIIFNNLYYNKMNGLINLIDKQWECYYTKIYMDIKENGWNKKYPARIGIGNKKEIFVHGGNHRINLILNLNLKYIPCEFIFLNNYKPNNNTYTKEGKMFYPNGLLPKWNL